MNILVVDDDAGFRLVGQAVVEAQGHVCRTADGGDQAWERYLAERPDVLITDRNMPGLDGLALCQRIRAQEEHSYTYIIVLTSLDDPGDVLSGMRAGADDYLAKPLDAHALQARLLAAERVTSLHAELAAARIELTRQARTDPLTGLLNRAGLTDDLADLDRRSERYGSNYCLALLDVDSFKRFNDTYGHPAGDHALRTVADLLAGDLRTLDRVYRYGGEEFLALLPEQTIDGARTALERVRLRLETAAIEHRGAGPDAVLTLSIGLAACQPGRRLSGTALIAEADRALYRAKANGRNRTVCAVAFDNASL